jgi:hypothetical protein
MRARALLALHAFALMASGCHKSEPPWAKPGAPNPGEATIAGTPAPVARAAAPPVIDGKLDDAVWVAAATLGPFVEPGSGAPAPHSPVASFARLAWDDRALYLAFVVRDAHPRSPFGRDDVDPHVWGAASGVEAMLQPGDPGDNRDYYELQLDVRGAVFDSHFDDYNQPITGTGSARLFGHQEWSSQVTRAVQIVDGRLYTVEAALPWSALAQARVPLPPRPGDTWRLNLYAFRDGQRQAVAWSPLRGMGNFHRTARFGRVRFE